VAPFGIFLNTGFSLRFTEIDQDFDPSWVILKTAVVHEIAGDGIDRIESTIRIGSDGLFKIDLDDKHGRRKLIWKER
jgi:hypothetical protein